MTAPSSEIEITSALVSHAAELAELGQLAAGYTLVLAGLQRARGFLSSGEPWVAGSIAQWEQYLEDYCRQFGVEMPLP